MTIPIIMLLLMAAPLSIAWLLSSMGSRRFDQRDAAALRLTLLFVFTGIGHFIQTAPMSQMLPPWVPERIFLDTHMGYVPLLCAQVAGNLARAARRAHQ